MTPVEMPVVEAGGSTGVALRLEGIRKTYGSVEAIRRVDIEVRRGEIHALLGDNGAGKSTLLKIAAGAVAPDEGVITLDGRRVAYRSPHEARELGIETVYQDLALALDRSSVANIFAGRELLRAVPYRWLRILDRRAMARRTAEIFESLEVPVTRPTHPVRSLSGGQRQAVAIARAAMWSTKVVLLDEPTAALSVHQRDRVLATVGRLRDRGLGVLMVTHNVSEILAVADRVTVMRMGLVAATAEAESVDLAWVIGAMIGGPAVPGLNKTDEANTDGGQRDGT